MNNHKYDGKNLSHRGQHVLADFIGVYGNETRVGNFVFNLMVEAIERTTMKIVHKNLEILNKDTPPGFTSFLSLDSSHISSHGYTANESGLLAIDCFTCGDTNPMEVVEYIKDGLLKEFPDMVCIYMKNHKRFHYMNNNNE
jgi:S-adenosylmethionine decarboxylase